MTENESRPGPASARGQLPPQHASYPPYYYGYPQQGPANPLLPQTQQPKPRKGGRIATLVGVSVLAAALIGGASGAAIVGLEGSTTTSSLTSVTGQQLSNSAPIDVSSVAAKVLPSVVQVNVTMQEGDAIGSGIILTSDGRILTNAHVVEGAVGDVTVVLSDGKKYQASVVGSDTKADIAVLQAKNATGLTAATLGDSSEVAVGSTVVAIGSPGGLQNTVTSGIVSALNRNLADVGGGQPQTPYSHTRNQASTSPSYTAIQTDASINQGNSGGPLVNTAGQVIGINSALYNPSSSSDGSAGSVGIGFAIPINDAKSIVTRITGG
jgi:putative serine protease PepD